MAITYVGGTSGTGTSSGYTVSLSGTLTGGSGSSPQEGDIVLVSTGFGSSGTQTAAMSCSGNQTGAYSQAHTPSFQNDTWDTNHGFYYAVQGATPDSTITIGRQTSTAYGGVTTIQVWRGVDPTTPLDATTVEAGAGNASRPDPGAITPATSGAIIVAAGTGMQTTSGSAFTIPSGMSNGVSQFSDGTTSDCGNFICSFAWSSGAYDPAAATGGTTSTSSSWRATTIALKPYVPPPQTLTASLFSSATTTFFAATVTAGSVGLAPSLVTNDNTFYSAAVSQAGGSQQLTPSLLSNSNTFYAHTLTPGVVSLAQSERLDNASAFYGHTLASGGVTLTQSSRLDNSQAFYAHSLATGAVTLAQSSRFDNSNTFYSHALSSGGTGLIQSTRLDNSSTVFAHTVAPGPVALAPSLFSNDSTFFAPAVSQAGPQTITQSTRLDIEPQFFAHTISDASVNTFGGMTPWSRERHAAAQQEHADRVRAERIKLGIIEPDAVEKQDKAPAAAKPQPFSMPVWLAKEQAIAKEAEQVAAKKEEAEQGAEDYWALHLYEQLLQRERARIAQEAIARREADVAFVIMTLAVLD